MTTELNTRSSRPIAIWLLIGVGMIIIQVLLGGITRLTGSGLSITEWNVVTGTLPPMNEQQWMTEFSKYQDTPQYQLLNSGFTIRDFKFIFFWEWFHRLWARLIGVVFAVPFIIFLVQKRFKPSMVKPMIILFLLGALQGAIGWIMVASGLTGDAIYVKPAKLAMHFVLALGLLAYAFWFALELLVPKEKIVFNTKINKLTIGILAVLLVQLVYGAFMAGHKAATAAPTWPDINGSIIPPNMFGKEGGLLDLIDNRITIHFIHRGLAYILLALVFWQASQLAKLKSAPALQNGRWLPAFLISIQLALGILSVLSSTSIIPNKWGLFEWMAQLHQLVAMGLLLTEVWLLYLVRRQRVI